MAAYTGVLGTALESRTRHGIEVGRFPNYTDFDISDAEAYHCGYSLKLMGGARYAVEYGCLAVETTISVWVKFDTNGSPALELLDGGELVARDTPAGDGTSWEQLSITETTTKQVYTVRMVNYGSGVNASAIAYFDDLQ